MFMRGTLLFWFHFLATALAIAIQSHVYGTHGFKKGKVAWEFVTTRDSQGDECICLGAGTKPVTSSSYDSSTHFWTIRAYNGVVYVPGGTRMTVSKIHQVWSCHGIHTTNTTHSTHSTHHTHHTHITRTTHATRSMHTTRRTIRSTHGALHRLVLSACHTSLAPTSHVEAYLSIVARCIRGMSCASSWTVRKGPSGAV